MLGSPVLSTCSEPLSTVGHSWEGLAYIIVCLLYKSHALTWCETRTSQRPEVAESCTANGGRVVIRVRWSTWKRTRLSTTRTQVSRWEWLGSLGIRDVSPRLWKEKKNYRHLVPPRDRPTDRPNESPVRWLFPARVLPPRYSRWNLNYQSVARDCPLYRRKREKRDLDNEMSFERTRVHLEHLFTLVNVWHLSKSFYITISTFVVKLLSGL